MYSGSGLSISPIEDMANCDIEAARALPRGHKKAASAARACGPRQKGCLYVKLMCLRLEWLVLYECLHSLVACQSERVVESCSGAVAVFGTLPEQALVVAQEGSALHL